MYIKHCACRCRYYSLIFGCSYIRIIYCAYRFCNIDYSNSTCRSNGQGQCINN
uniref:EB domain-containing protein n=1 Tax=Ascaris lumbricoides TaxID=6252 RepID=A0A0M3IMT9_ASCLU